MKFLAACLLSQILFLPQLWGQENETPVRKLKLTIVEVEGLGRTNRSVVDHFLGFKSGDERSPKEIEEGIENLKSIGLFSEVSSELKESENEAQLTISVKERWTTIPILKYSAGGGTSQLTLGLYDPNILGQYVESGGQYERLGKTDSGVFWFKHPYLFGRKIVFDFQLWKTNRLRTKYFQDRVEQEVLTGFLHKRERIHAAFDFAVIPHLFLGATYEYVRDQFSTQYLPDEVKEKAVAKGLPKDTTLALSGYKLSYKNLKSDLLQSDGIRFSLTHRNARVQTDNIDDFYIIELDSLMAKKLFFSDMIALRLKGGFTNTEVLQYWFYLGGLSQIRGFTDNRFAGSRYWLTNLEYRIPSYKTSNLILQHAIFYDVVSVGEDTGDLRAPKGASAGIGLRFIAPKIYRFVARIDYAIPVLKQDKMPLSFGVQQFF